MHFERIARDYVGARPPYPRFLYEALLAQGVIGPHARVLEVGAGTGLATREVVGSGSEVVALEPGAELAELLRMAVPDASIVVARLEDADLPPGAFDSAIAATSMHWVDLSIGLPKLHAALRPGGWLVMEIGFSTEQPVKDLLAGWTDVQTAADLQGIPRVIAARRA